MTNDRITSMQTSSTRLGRFIDLILAVDDAG
jgi:hypothetical protein